MQQFIDCFIEFIIANWQWLAPIVLSVVEAIIIILFKKKPIIKDSSLYSDLSDLILQAEYRFGRGHGEEKLNFVIDSILDKRKEQFNDIPVTRDLIRSQIEYLLLLPQKKGGK